MSVKKSEENAERQIALLRGRLRLHAALGIREYPANRALHRFFSLTGPGSAFGAEPFPVKEKKDPLAGRADKVAGELDRLGRECGACDRCPQAGTKAGSVPGRGSPECSLMVVGDWSVQEADKFSAKIMFGPEEDAMLWKMMAAIGLAPGDIYVTNCLKCCPGGGPAPDAECFAACFSYLEREIALAGPRIICAMGESAAAMLTGSREPLLRLRGRFVPCRSRTAREIIVMPTYHPRFLLRHQEMKMAAWHDLKAIRKKLAGRG